MPYLGNVPSSFNVGTDNINNDAITTAKIADGAILNADVNAAAAIAGTKISPDFGSQTIATTGIFSHALGSVSAPTITFTGDLNTGIWSPAADTIAFSEGGVEAMRIDASGRLGIGTTSASYALDVRTTGTSISSSFTSDQSEQYIALKDSGTTIGHVRLGSTSGSMLFFAGNGERGRFDSSGRLLVGTSSASSIGGATPLIHSEVTSATWAFAGARNTADANGASIVLAKSRGTTAGSTTTVQNGDQLGAFYFAGANGSNLSNLSASIEAYVDGAVSGGGANDMPGRLVFSTTADGASSPTERMRIGNNGTVLAQKTAAGLANEGLEFVWGAGLGVTNNQNPVIRANRLGTDGGLVDFYQDGTLEGNISVSGTTVFFNGAHLARWSQISGINPHDKTDRPEVLRGTVMSNLDEMCNWTDPETGKTQDNEQLNKTIISNIESDNNVAGVFDAWDDDDDTWVNDYHLAMTGDFVIRIAGDVTVERGDLLMSAGDGTAKPQDDDIIRSKTIAKVTSTNVSCTYDDGSYCVPCVLMAC